MSAVVVMIEIEAVEFDLGILIECVSMYVLVWIDRPKLIKIAKQP